MGETENTVITLGLVEAPCALCIHKELCKYTQGFEKQIDNINKTIVELNALVAQSVNSQESEDSDNILKVTANIEQFIKVECRYFIETSTESAE